MKDNLSYTQLLCTVYRPILSVMENSIKYHQYLPSSSISNIQYKSKLDLSIRRKSGHPAIFT